MAAILGILCPQTSDIAIDCSTEVGDLKNRTLIVGFSFEFVRQSVAVISGLT